jgi:hypothetical protein
MITTYPPIPADVGTFLVQMGAVSVVDQYRSGTLPMTTRRFVDMTIRQCELQDGAAQRWVDRVAELSLRDWAKAQLVDDAVEEARSMTIASCTLAAFMLWSERAAGA